MQLPTLLGKTCMYLLPNRANLGSCTQGNRSSNMRFGNEWWPPLTLPKSNIMIVDAILVPNNRAVSTIVREVLVADNNVSSTLGPQSCQHKLLRRILGLWRILEFGFQTFEGHFNSLQKENGKKKCGLIFKHLILIYLFTQGFFLIWLFVVCNLSTTWPSLPSFLIHQKLFSNSCLHTQSPPAHMKTCLKTNMPLLNKHTKMVVLFKNLFLFKKLLTILETCCCFTFKESLGNTFSM